MLLRHFLIALVALVILDAVWLGFIMSDFYRQSLSHLARMADGRLDPVWPVAAMVYPVIAAGIALFVLPRASTPAQALMFGAAFGVITFAVYDLTNHATLRDWRPLMTVVDIGWGGVSCGLSAFTTALLTRS